MERFSKRVYAVTGAAGGIGSAISSRLASEGAEVFALDTRPGPVGTFVEVDVTDVVSVHRAFDQVISVSGHVDGLVAGAGVIEGDIAAESMAPTVFDRTIAVNLRGVFLVCQAFGRHMLSRGEGSIVTISSMSGNHIVNSPQNQCAYNASKAAVSALTRSLAVEWGARGVRVNSIAPGYVRTPLLDAKSELFEFWQNGTVLGRFAEPDEIAATVAFLLSDEASFFCGSEILVDGGYSLR